MKKLIGYICLTFSLLFLGLNGNVFAAETKKICKDVTVKGKTTQKCKNVKIHKKLEGTKVPEKSKAPVKAKAPAKAKKKTTGEK